MVSRKKRTIEVFRLHHWLEGSSVYIGRGLMQTCSDLEALQHDTAAQTKHPAHLAALLHWLCSRVSLLSISRGACALQLCSEARTKAASFCIGKPAKGLYSSLERHLTCYRLHSMPCTSSSLEQCSSYRGRWYYKLLIHWPKYKPLELGIPQLSPLLSWKPFWWH